MRMARKRIAATDTRTTTPKAHGFAAVYVSREHAAWRQDVIGRANGRCQDATHRGPNVGLKIYADHVKELRDGGTHTLDNGMARCASCHSRKTAAERARRMGITR